MKRFFKFRYPKLLILLLAIILAYFIFKNPTISNYASSLGTLSYIGIFIAGILFAFGFTAPFAVGFFITLNPSNIWIAALIGGFGAMLADLLVLKLIRFSFKDEFTKLKKEKITREINSLIRNFLGDKVRVYLMYAFAGFLIASPLPDEVGVIMLAGLTKINSRLLAIISFMLNTIGILIILNI